MLLFDKDRPEQAYRTKERFCENCGDKIYFETRFGSDGWIITKDGKRPNGLDPPDNNVKWFCMTALSKTDHICKKDKDGE